jgi:hypothetical protein
MFGRHFFGAAYFGPRYFGDGGDLEPILALGELFVAGAEEALYAVAPEASYYVVP